MSALSPEIQIFGTLPIEKSRYLLNADALIDLMLDRSTAVRVGE